MAHPAALPHPLPPSMENRTLLPPIDSRPPGPPLPGPSFPPIAGHDLPPPQPPSALQAALRLLAEPAPPSVREILHAYAKNDSQERELLLALLAAKTAEDNRISAQAQLHRSLMHIHYGLPPPSCDKCSAEHAAASASPPFQPSHLHARPTPPSFYPSPETSSHHHSRSPPDRTLPPITSPHPVETFPPITLPSLATALGKRSRTPPPPPLPRHSSANAASVTTRTSPMSLRGLLHDSPPFTPSLPPPMPKNSEGRRAKRQRTETSNAQGMPAVVDMMTMATPATSPRTHLTSHERTTSRDDNDGELDGRRYRNERHGGGSHQLS